ncbi:hypothetical protein [Daejeonella sp.]|jgi:uncharacterized membrane protein (UPF0136 family)|uniref:hypothetical protein n=1 Tax=Daejeonella sp. TaxID=2805397 RepID=UPI003783D1E9
MKTKILALLNLLAFAFHLTFTSLVQMGKLSKMDMAQTSAKYDTVFAPAGITFSIWGIIYLALISFSLYHLYAAFYKAKNEPSNLITNSLGVLFIINNLATALWLLAWLNEELLISVILMLIQLTALILIHIRLNRLNIISTFSFQFFTNIPLSIYFGWISIATIANISAYLKSINWTGGISESLWAIILIAIASLITLFMVIIRKNIPFGLVVLWALYGIVLKRQQVNAIEFESVIQASFMAFIIIFIGLIIRLLKIVKPAKEF